MRHIIPKLMFLWILLSVSLVAAQGTCSALIEEALTATDENCTELGRNMACYGHNQVEAAFLSTVDDDFFITPADVASISELQTIATAGLDEASDIWGVAVMNLQANIPNTLPGQNVTFVLMGDTEVENAVDPETVYTPTDGISLSVPIVMGGNIRSGPGTNYNVIGAAAYNTELQVDGRSEDDEWLRVAFDDRVGWVNRIVVEDSADIAELPILTSELRTPMQAFYLRTGVGSAECEEVPDNLLLVQGPDDIEIELTVNGANIAAGSSGALRTIEVDGELFLEITVFDGTFTVLADEYNPRDVPIRPGFRSLLCLGDPDSRGLNGQADDRHVACGASRPERIPAQHFGEEWCALESIPHSILNYGIQILCPGEIIVQAPPSSSGGGGSATDSQVEGVDCSNFELVGPFSGITPRPTTFVWTEAPGATQYEIVFYGYDGNTAATYWTSETSFHINVGEVPTGSELAWEVRAYQDGAYACVTARTPTIFRLADPIPPPPKDNIPGFSCGSLAADFGGMWSNPTYTGGISRIEITFNGNTPSMRWWGQCGGGECTNGSGPGGCSSQSSLSFVVQDVTGPSYFAITGGGSAINASRTAVYTDGRPSATYSDYLTR